MEYPSQVKNLRNVNKWTNAREHKASAEVDIFYGGWLSYFTFFYWLGWAWAEMDLRISYDKEFGGWIRHDTKTPLTENQREQVQKLYSTSSSGTTVAYTTEEEPHDISEWSDLDE